MSKFRKKSQTGKDNTAKVSKATRPAINLETVRQEKERKSKFFHLIGLFLFNFSQLEFTIRAVLGAALNLPDGQFDVVTAPYDFAKLCTVTKNILMQKFPKESDRYKKLFDECYKLNDSRVKVAHGLWSDNGKAFTVRCVNRDKLEARHYFSDPNELRQLADRAQRLMKEVLVYAPHS
jgi:hypothetical protein